MSKRAWALLWFLGGIAWPYFWEFVRSWIYEEVQHVMEPYIPSYDAALRYGPAAVLGCLGLWLFYRAGQSSDTDRLSSSRTVQSEIWPLRDLFAHLAPHLPLRATKRNESGGFVDGIDLRWKPIGDMVLKPLSLGKLHASGRQRTNGRRLQASPITVDFWRDAKFTYWFLDAGPSNVQDASNDKVSYSEIEIDRAEAMSIWPNGAEFSLLEAARQIYEHVKVAPIGVVIEGLTDGPDDILTWICNEIAMHRNGKEPLVKLHGNKPPSRNLENIYTASLARYDFIVEGNSIVLQERYGKARYENLTVSMVEIDRAIRELASRRV
jgi:hypothetical protein